MAGGGYGISCLPGAPRTTHQRNSTQGANCICTVTEAVSETCLPDAWLLASHPSTSVQYALVLRPTVEAAVVLRARFASSMSFDHVLAFARQRSRSSGLFGSGKGWTDRARARVGRRKYEELMASQGHEGDESLNSAEAFAQRQALRNHPLVRNMLTLFWALALSAARHKRPDAVDLSFDDYLITYRALFRSIVGEEDYDEAEADECALDEFFSDSGAMGFMTQPQFCGGMFEVADLHVDTLEAEDYVKFLNDLFESVTPAVVKASGMQPIDLKRDKQSLLRVACDAEQAQARGINQLAACGMVSGSSAAGGSNGGRHEYGSGAGECAGAGRGVNGLDDACGGSGAHVGMEMEIRQGSNLCSGMLGANGSEQLLSPRSSGIVYAGDRGATDYGDHHGRRRRGSTGDEDAHGEHASTHRASQSGAWSDSSMMVGKDGINHFRPHRRGQLSPGRHRPNCIGCRGEGLLCVECERNALTANEELGARLRNVVPLLPPPMLSPLPMRKDAAGDALRPRLSALPRFTMAILRPSRSLPPGALSCGYGYGSPGIDQYRRALSSPQALTAYVEGRERHHRRREAMCDSGRNGLYTPYTGTNDVTVVDHGRVSGRAGLSTALPPSLWSRPGTKPTSPFLSRPGTKGNSPFPSRPGTMGTSALPRPATKPSSPWERSLSKAAYPGPSSIRALARTA